METWDGSPDYPERWARAPRPEGVTEDDMRDLGEQVQRKVAEQRDDDEKETA